MVSQKNSILQAILSKKLGILAFFFVSFSVFGSTSTSTNTTTASQDLAKTDITTVGMNMFTTAYNWEIGANLWYNSDAYHELEKRLNETISTEIPELVKACGGCSEVLKSWFGDALANFLKKTHNKTGSPDYFTIAKPYFHEKILQSAVLRETVRKFNLFIDTTIQEIGSQVTDQMNNFRDVSGMWLYFDGDTKNSPYDLLDDLRRIDEIFFRTAPDFGDYKNSSKDDASALITGQVKQGAWIGGENYKIDLLGDIKNSLGNSNDEWKYNTSAEAGAGNCSEWYCISIDFIQNTHYFLSGSSQWTSSKSSQTSSSGGKTNNSSFQAIFEEGLEWIIKHGDKRNFACKAAATINEYESNDDAWLKLSKIFTGLGIHTFWKTPPFLLSFINRRVGTTDTTNSTSNKASSTTSGGGSSSSQSKEDKKTEDALRDAYSRNGFDFDRPTNLKSTTKWAYTSAALYDGNHRDVRAIDLAEWQRKWSELYESSLVEKWKWSERLLIHQENTDSIKHIEKTFDDLLSRIQMIVDYNDRLNKVLKYLKEKPDCTN